MNLNKPSTQTPLQADSISELSAILSVNRRSISRWVKDHTDAPIPDHNGLHDVEAWRSFIASHELNQSNRTAGANDSQETADWKEEKVRLECERIAIGNAKLAGTLIEADEAKAALSALIGGLRQAINNVPGRMADKVLHITDHHEAEEIITEEMNVLLKTIAKCDFLE
jgi:phage terminase Nu1 subunit (DNA packaging protein)